MRNFINHFDEISDEMTRHRIMKLIYEYSDEIKSSDYRNSRKFLSKESYMKDIAFAFGVISLLSAISIEVLGNRIYPA